MATKEPSHKSLTKDERSHHTSPTGNKPQQDLTPVRARTVTGTVRTPSLPMHVTKHSNPVGRPKAPR